MIDFPLLVSADTGASNFSEVAFFVTIRLVIEPFLFLMFSKVV